MKRTNRLVSLLLVTVMLLTTIGAEALAVDNMTRAYEENGLCITEIAKGELGYEETGINVTKYGEWYGMQDAWCVMFISWCAEQAGISTAVIPKTASNDYLCAYYSNLGTYYRSPSQGGTVEPQVGDIYFVGTSYTTTSHAGIIVDVDDAYIYTVDGNWSNKVSARTISKTSSDFVGFARPNYTTDHSYSYQNNGTTHYKVCSICEHTTALTGHSCNWQYDNTGHWGTCLMCQATVTHTAHDCYWSSTVAGHSGTCSTCGAVMTNVTHNFVTYGVNAVCSQCGYTITLMKGIE